jgi:hypothetical protein
MLCLCLTLWSCTKNHDRSNGHLSNGNLDRQSSNSNSDSQKRPSPPEAAHSIKRFESVWKKQTWKNDRGEHEAIPLPDYSYAGYALGTKGIPQPSGQRFNVTDHGALPNDGISDRDAIEKTIRAAEQAGGGVVYFPKGRFLINEKQGVTKGIVIQGANIVLKGEGSGPNGTELFMKAHLDSTTPKKLYSTPHMISFKSSDQVKKQRKKQGHVIKDAKAGSFSVLVDDIHDLKVNDLVQLFLSNNKGANELFLEGKTTWGIWENINKKGVTVKGELHRIKAIKENTLIFDEPLHANIKKDHQWKLYKMGLTQGWGVEDIHFRGNWKEKFVHHKNIVHDSGWSWLLFNYGEHPYVRRSRFSDCSAAVKVSACYGATIINCSIEGHQGHHSFSSSYNAFGTLIAFCIDAIKEGAFHGFGASSGAVGTVITHCKNSNRGFDWHGGGPYSTLLDHCSGGLIGNGGSYKNLPNHLGQLTFWNFQQSSGKALKDYDFWSPQHGDELYSGAKVVNPNIVGFHGINSTFKKESCKVLQSHGTAVEPQSLYLEQLKERLGKVPLWAQEAKEQYEHYLVQGFWL